MWERLTDGISDFHQTVGMDPGSNLLTFPSTWNNLLKQSLLKCSKQTMNWPLGLNFFQRKQTKAFHSASVVCCGPMQVNSSRRIQWITISLDNTAVYNAARTRRKQQLLNSFLQIKIHLFFSVKTSTLHTELARFLVFWLWLWRQFRSWPNPSFKLWLF